MYLLRALKIFYVFNFCSFGQLQTFLTMKISQIMVPVKPTLLPAVQQKRQKSGPCYILIQLAGSINVATCMCEKELLCSVLVESTNPVTWWRDWLECSGWTLRSSPIFRIIPVVDDGQRSIAVTSPATNREWRWVCTAQDKSLDCH